MPGVYPMEYPRLSKQGEKEIAYLKMVGSLSHSGIYRQCFITDYGITKTGRLLLRFALPRTKQDFGVV